MCSDMRQWDSHDKGHTFADFGPYSESALHDTMEPMEPHASSHSDTTPTYVEQSPLKEAG